MHTYKTCIYIYIYTYIYIYIYTHREREREALIILIVLCPSLSCSVSGVRELASDDELLDEGSAGGALAAGLSGDEATLSKQVW